MNEIFGLADTLTMAQQAVGDIGHYAADGSLRGVTKMPAAAVREFDLRSVSAPAGLAADGTRSLAPNGTGVGKLTSIATSLFDRCRTVRAGANVIIATETPGPSANGVLSMYSQAGKFVLVEPAHFQATADGADAATGQLQTFTAPIAWPEISSISFHCVLNRASRRDSGFDIDAALETAILAGLVRAADECLLKGIIAAGPAMFDLGMPAARGIEFAALRAISGTAATGAAVGPDGVLRVAGIQAEFTPAITQSVIADFSKTAIAVHPSIRVVADRRGTNGDLGVVCYASVLALVPDSTATWLAA